MAKRYWLALGLAAVLLLFFGNGSLLVTDSVESNYALTAKEMVLSGDWLSPQIYGHYWYDKPILFYWLTAVSFKLLGFTEFAARLAPALFGLAGLALICYGGTRLYNERTGFYSGVMLLTSIEFFLISKSIITDAVLFFFFSATLLFFYLGYRDGRARYWYLMYASAALAVLTKGPIGILLPGLIITLFLLWQRDWRLLLRCRLLSGCLLFAVLCVPWYAAMYSIHGSEFINTFFGIHNYLRATVSEHPRDNVVYYYLLVNVLALFPWGLLLPWAAWQHYRRQGWRLAAREGFLLLWAATVFCFFQSMATKYITYTYPLVFPMMLFLGHIADEYGEQCFYRGYKLVIGGFFAILLAAAWWCSASGILQAEELYLLPLSLILGLLLYYALQRHTQQTLLGLGALCLCFYLALISSIAVPLAEQRSAKELGQLLQADRISTAGIYGNYPTSAVFYSDSTLLKLIAAKDVADYLPKDRSWSSKNVMPYATLEEQRCGLVAVSNKRLEDFLAKDGSVWVIAGKAEGWLLLRREAAGSAGLRYTHPELLVWRQAADGAM